MGQEDMPNFWETGVPQTDEEAKDALRKLAGHPIFAGAVVGIYECRRALGDDITEALVQCLLALVGEAE